MPENTCQAVQDRKMLTEGIYRACCPNVGSGSSRSFDGSHKQLMDIMDVLHGIVAEYADDGDQMIELCTCGEHNRDA